MSPENEESNIVRADGALVNGLVGMGVYGRDKSTATRIATSVPLLSQVELEALYLVGLPRRFVDAVADEALKHKVTITLGNASSDSETQAQIQAFEQYLKTRGFYEAFADAQRLQRLYGGAVILILVDDGQEDFSQPLNVNNIRDIQGFVPLSRYEIAPGDYSVLDYSRPEFYRITTMQKLEPDQKMPFTNLQIHSSRVVRFDGFYLPWNLRQQNEGWGEAAMQILWNAWKTYETSISGLSAGILDGSQFWHKIPGLMNMVKAGNTSEIMKRLEINNLARSVYGGMLLDGGNGQSPGEEIGFSERSLANLATASAPFSEYLQATTGWPASILMGSSPGGLGKEGRFEERTWASIVEKWQTVYTRSAVEQVFELIFLAKRGPFRGRTPRAWEVYFPSVFVRTEEEETNLRQTQANVDSIYYNMGALHPMEIRQNRFGGPKYSVETALDPQASMVLAQKQQASDFMALGLNPDGSPQAPPPPEAGTPSEKAAGSPSGSTDGNAASGSTAKRKDEGPPAALPPPAPKRQPRPPVRYDNAGITLEPIIQGKGIVLGRLLRCDGAPEDVSPVMLLGPAQKRMHRIYKATNIPGIVFDSGSPAAQLYLSGFGSLRCAREAVFALWPTARSVKLVRAPELELINYVNGESND